MKKYVLLFIFLYLPTITFAMDLPAKVKPFFIIYNKPSYQDEHEHDALCCFLDNDDFIETHITGYFKPVDRDAHKDFKTLFYSSQLAKTEQMVITTFDNQTVKYLRLLNI